MDRHHSSAGPMRPCGRPRAAAPGRRARAALLCAVLLAMSGATPAESKPQLRVVDAEQLIGLALTRPEMVIIDSRMPTDRAHGYIEGSASLADADTDCDSLARLAPAKSTPLAFYCNGPRCNRSAVAGEIALGCGYRESYWFRGGFEEWQHKGYPTLLD